MTPGATTANPDPTFAHTVDSDIIQTTKPQRLLSIDVLRGLTLAFMIIVNDQTGRGAFTQLQHAQWNGFTATDLVFPTFLFLVGLSTVLSLAARVSRGVPRQTLWLHVLRRALILIAAGFIVNNFPKFHLASLRFYGVLARIGLCYFVVATLYLLSPTWRDKLAIAIACLVTYWALMRFVPVPGYGIPTVNVPINDMDGNLTAWLDRQLFSPGHLYQRVRDPEGLLSTIPAIATTLFGLLTGLWLRTTRTFARKSGYLAAAGAVCITLGLLWNIWFPINKKLWTSSYTLLAGGLSMLLLAASIYLVDALRLARPTVSGLAPEPDPTTRWSVYTPLLVFGTNSILAYMISELGDSLLHGIHLPSGVSLKAAAFHAVAAVIPQPAWASLVNSLLFMLLCWLLVLPFYLKRIFLRI